MEQIETNMQRETLMSKVKSYSVLAILVVIAIGSYLGTTRLPYPIVDAMLEQDIRYESKLWRKRVLEQLSDAPASFATGNVNAADQAFLLMVTHTSDIYRFKLFDTDGRVLWSSRSSDIGTQTPNAHFYDQILNGTAYYKHETQDAGAIDDFALHALADTDEMQREVAEIYSPVATNGVIIGAIEFYLDITDRRDTQRAGKPDAAGA